LEWLLEEYGPDGFLPIMLMYDGQSAENLAYAEEYKLTFPVLSDLNMEVFGRWNPTGVTPSTTLIDRDLVVYAIDTTWYPAQVEGLVYPE
jgi:peroxiredoxin